MTTMIATYLFGLFAACSPAPQGPTEVEPPVNPERVFRGWANFFGGGVWQTTVNGRVHEHRYQRIAEGRFQTGETIDAGNRAQLVVGVDPRNHKCRIWQFGSDGCFTLFEITQAGKDVWLLHGAGCGPKGRSRYRSKVVRTGPDSTREEMLEYVLNGEKRPTTIRVWTRTKEGKSKPDQPVRE